jgi:pSer/pThr/pTyr-binding forkhead associated (FHA) protein
MLKLEATIEVGDQAKVINFETDEVMFTIGRESKNDFQLPLTTVSRQHCRISQADEQWFVEDLGSSHGTALNGQKLNANEKKLLRTGDVLAITKAKIKVEIVKSQIERSPGEKTEMLAKRAVEDILRGLDGGTQQDDVPYLRIMTGPDEGQTFKFRGAMAECVLGRSRESDLVINDANASRRHALVKKDYSGVTYQCLGAKNLSTLNGKEVPRNAVKRLRDRDEIAIGAVKIVFIDPDAELLKSLSDIPGFEEPMDPDPEPAEELPASAAEMNEEPSHAAPEAMGDENSLAGPGEDSIAEPPPTETPAQEIPEPQVPVSQQVEVSSGMDKTQIIILVIAALIILIGTTTLLAIIL